VVVAPAVCVWTPTTLPPLGLRAASLCPLVAALGEEEVEESRARCRPSDDDDDEEEEDDDDESGLLPPPPAAPPAPARRAPNAWMG
jgi:hypothetical protein